MNVETTVKVSSELCAGDIVWCHGMRVLIDGPINSRESGGLYGPGDKFVYWTSGLVLNRGDVSDNAVPYSFTRPRLSNGYPDDAAIARGEHRWTIQGNDNARWCIEVPE